MASAILFTVFLIYLHTYTCFGQQSNFFNQNNFGKKQLGTAGAQSSPNSFFFKNFTRIGNNGNSANPQQRPLQQMTNSQNPMYPQPEQPFNMQQAMALQQMNMQSMSNLQQQPFNNLQTGSIPAPYNVPTNMHSSLSQSEPVQNYNIPPTSVMSPLQGQQMSYQLPTHSAIPMHYSLKIPQAIPPYSMTSNYGIPPTAGCSTPISVPVTFLETSQMYSPNPSFNPYLISKPSIPKIYPSFDPNQSVMIGQNDVVLNAQDPLSSVYLSILQTPPNSPQYTVAPSYPINSVGASDHNQSSKSSSLKALLPIIINLLKEKSNPCPCHSSCNCEGKKKRTSKPQVTSSYSKQKKYPLSDDGPAIEQFSEELETTRNVREPKKSGKLKNKIPNESTEVHDDESLEYSENDENEEE